MKLTELKELARKFAVWAVTLFIGVTTIALAAWWGVKVFNWMP